MSNELAYLSASEALARFATRELSPVELMDAVIERAQAVESTVNAFPHTYFDEARAQARQAELVYGGRGGASPRPLEGLPVAIKAEEAIAGQPWSQGSLLAKDVVADYTSTFVQRQLDAGAIVHARTATPEFSCAGFTHTKLWGVTRNPHNPEFAVGGSSGGSAASLAAGTSTLASGSDIAGSIRIPSAACGVVGFKPPYGRVPQDPPFNLDTYCHCGPLARTVADCALYENVLVGAAGDDVVSLREDYRLPAVLPDARGLRVAVSQDLGNWPVDQEMRDNTLAAAAALREAGAIVEEVELSVPREQVLKAMAIHFRYGWVDVIAESIAAQRELVCDYTLEVEGWVRELAGDASFFEGLALEAELYRPVGELLTRYDALLVPTSGRASLEAGKSYVEEGIEVAGQLVGTNIEVFLTPVFNVMSRLPVLAVPSGRAAGNAPTGVQIVGRSYDDLTVFRLGAALEAVKPWQDWPETIG